jgi:hypothetical protein
MNIESVIKYSDICIELICWVQVIILLTIFLIFEILNNIIKLHTKY